MLAARREKVAIIREFQGTAIKVFKSGSNKESFGAITLDYRSAVIDWRIKNNQFTLLSDN